MRVLGYIHTFNDAEIIERTVEALQRQTRPPDAILVVDNGSRDDTIDRISSWPVTIIRNPTNLGTSGAVCVGFEYALKHQFDWIWLFDADSLPQPDALENLLAAFQKLPASEQDKVCFLGCRLRNAHPPMMFSTGGKPTEAAADDSMARCDCALWSGSLYRIAAIEKIGLPQANYVLDWGELEYGYRAWSCGYTSYIVASSRLRHDIGRPPGISTYNLRIGPFGFRIFNTSPTRCYYFVRNAIYFWLYQCRPRRSCSVARMMLVCLGFTTGFLVRPIGRHPQLIACLRGIRDGLTGRIERRY